MNIDHPPAQASDEPMRAAPELTPVIYWLEGGCDPYEAAKELRIYQRKIGQTEAPAIIFTQRATVDVQRLPNWRKLTRWTFDGGGMFAEVSKDGQWLAVKDVECMMAHIDATIAATKGAKP